MVLGREPSARPVGEEREPDRLLVGEQRHVEGLGRVLRAGGDGRRGVGEARRPVGVLGIDPGRQGGAIDEAAVAAQQELPLLVGDPERRALRVGRAREDREREVLQPLAVERPEDLEALSVERLRLHELEVLGEQLRVLPPEPHARERLLADLHELVPVHRLREEVGAPRLHRLDREAHVVVAGDRDRLEVGVALLRLAHERDPVEPRHHDVGEEDVEVLLGEELQRVRPGRGDADLVARGLDQLAEQLLEEPLVVDDEDAPGAHLEVRLAGEHPLGRAAHRDACQV